MTMGFKIENGVLVKYTEEPGVTEVVIPDGVTSIGALAFEQCHGLTDIVIPDGVTSIGENAFDCCSGLKSIVIPDGVTSIARYTFAGCSSLTDIVLPDSVTSIAECAFHFCSKLKSIVLPAGVTYIGRNAFTHCQSLTSIVIPGGVTGIGRNTFYGCKKLTDIVLPDGVTGIEERAFADCSGLTGIVLPDSVTNIGDWAFSDCKSLTDIVIPKGVTRIGMGVFSGCKSLTGVVIPDNVTGIGKNVFKNCDNLTSLHISMQKLCELKNQDLWTYCELPTEETELKAFCIAVKKCPQKAIPAVEAKLLQSPLRAAAEYFEKRGRLEEYAACHSNDADTLRDTTLSDFGLDSSGCRSWVLAGKTYTAQLWPDLTITLKDETGRIINSLPKKGAEPEQYERVRKSFAQLKKEIPAAAKLRAGRLFTEFLQKYEYTAQRWKSTYLVNPLLTALARLVVWQQGAVTFILDTQRVPSNAYGEAVELTDAPIILAHPMELDAETVKAWQDYFTAGQLKQPFAQMWEPVIGAAFVRPDRYDGCTIEQYQLMNKDRHGIILHGQSRLELKDCSADLEFKEGHHEWVHNLYEVKNFTFTKYTRQVNHIVVLLDKGTVSGRILKDDVTVEPWLGEFTLAQIMEFIDLAAKNNCPNVGALLQQYKQDHFDGTDPMDMFTLDLL